MNHKDPFKYAYTNHLNLKHLDIFVRWRQIQARNDVRQCLLVLSSVRKNIYRAIPLYIFFPGRNSGEDILCKPTWWYLLSLKHEPPNNFFYVNPQEVSQINHFLQT